MTFLWRQKLLFHFAKLGSQTEIYFSIYLLATAFCGSRSTFYRWDHCFWWLPLPSTLAQGVPPLFQGTLGRPVVHFWHRTWRGSRQQYQPVPTRKRDCLNYDYIEEPVIRTRSFTRICSNYSKTKGYVRKPPRFKFRFKRRFPFYIQRNLVLPFSI